jgi:retron-type reverse transcriptase
MTTTGIINGVIKFKSSWDTTKSGLKVRKDLSKTNRIRELWDHLRVNLKRIPNNQYDSLFLGLHKSGDGVAMVHKNVGRATVYNLYLRTLTTKAGLIYQARRGSDIKILNNTVESSNYSSLSAGENLNLDINMKKISNLKNLVTAYESIKSKPGNMTAGLDSETLDGLSLDGLKKKRKKLRAGIYEFPPARRINIAKEGNNETRPLSIASPRVKIVQQALKQVMEPLYELKFLDCSHGFRPQRGPHTAILYMEAKFQSCHYVIEADFAKAFDSIIHSKLIEIIQEDVKCKKTVTLIREILKAGYVEFGNLHDNLNSGTPQGSVLSPLLCNIFLNKLDEFMSTVAEKYRRGEKRQKNKEYEKLVNSLRNNKRKGYDKQAEFLDQFEKVKSQMLKTASRG